MNVSQAHGVGRNTIIDYCLASVDQFQRVKSCTVIPNHVHNLATDHNPIHLHHDEAEAKQAGTCSPGIANSVRNPPVTATRERLFNDH